MPRNANTKNRKGKKEKNDGKDKEPSKKGQESWRQHHMSDADLEALQTQRKSQLAEGGTLLEHDAVGLHHRTDRLSALEVKINSYHDKTKKLDETANGDECEEHDTKLANRYSEGSRYLDVNPPSLTREKVVPSRSPSPPRSRSPTRTSPTRSSPTRASKVSTPSRTSVPTESRRTDEDDEKLPLIKPQTQRIDLDAEKDDGLCSCCTIS